MPSLAIMAALARTLKSLSSPFKPRVSMLDWHDDWNIYALGALNVAQICLWTGVLPASALTIVGMADGVYFAIDSMWLVFAPDCVPQKVRKTLLVHHFAVLCASACGIWRPLCAVHATNAWIVELQSWTHIAARRLNEPLAKYCELLNKPLYVLTRFIIYPLTWFRYNHLRNTLPTGTSQIPTQWQFISSSSCRRKSRGPRSAGRIQCCRKN